MPTRTSKPAARNTPRKTTAKARGRTATSLPKPPSRAPAHKDWRSLRAEDVMQRNVVTLDARAPLPEVERVFAENHISGAPVIDEGGRVVGVLSLRDLVYRYTEDPDARPRRSRSFYLLDAEDLGEAAGVEIERTDAGEDTAGDVMTRQVLAVAAETPLREVAAKMVHENVHRLLVRDGQQMLGIVSTMDLLRAAAR